jgi:hypothetical protein
MAAWVVFGNAVAFFKAHHADTVQSLLARQPINSGVSLLVKDSDLKRHDHVVTCCGESRGGWVKPSGKDLLH